MPILGKLIAWSSFFCIETILAFTEDSVNKSINFFQQIALKIRTPFSAYWDEKYIEYVCVEFCGLSKISLFSKFWGCKENLTWKLSPIGIEEIKNDLCDEEVTGSSINSALHSTVFCGLKYI